ncbi:MAG: rod shape-determining protein MreC [Desulfuromonas sp.]|nr:MAG: rod shape-determining protein MreC [Desulfuromonas sp.]
MLELLRRFRRPILVFALILAALLLYSANLRRGGGSTFFERSVLGLTSPLHKLIDVACKGAADTWNHYLWLIETEEENERLLKQNRWLQNELAEVDETRLENERLRKLLDFKEEVQLPTLPAQVISEDASSWFRTVIIDKGSEDGLEEGMPVVVAEGVVGRTVRVAPHQSTVLLVTDASSAVASLVQSSRTRGVCRGQGAELTLDFALRLAEIKVGDRIVTSGTGGVFPKGLVIGSVRQVVKKEYGLFQSVSVEPSVDFSRLEEVLVLLREGP